ncbi:SAM-dependent methyltransferase [Vibrio coralliilyticus]|uniref:class I SAM-dependent methyltransferase n=1 Tax=Vibrio coralliilyticus TaxID=190893 RepID=UPI000BAAF2A1|nr:class I SAM-dependent methyltransferase [Vibrio coralliilyticus]PAU39208.1 SAM-dependent methyltransferase [Vibrio coralliilyticus]
MSSTASFYEKNAIKLAKQYDSLEFESVHKSWSAYWPNSGVKVLDVGAGSGRDARWFSERGCSVVAIEPSQYLREIGKQNCSDKVVWLADSLPSLEQAICLVEQYDVVLLSAVWMHLPVNQRDMAIRVLSNLLSDNGLLVITLRHGKFKDSRETFGVSVSELERLCRDVGLFVLYVTDDEDALQREEVSWQTVVIKKSSAMEG